MFAAGTLYSSGCMEARTSLRMLVRFRLGDRRSDWNSNTTGMKLPCPVRFSEQLSEHSRGHCEQERQRPARMLMVRSPEQAGGYMNSLSRRRTKFLDSS